MAEPPAPIRGEDDSPNEAPPGVAPHHRTRRRWWRWLLAAVVAVVLLAGSGFAIWASATPDPGPSAQAAVVDGDGVSVLSGDGYAFVPDAPTTVGLILYPGARVDPASYAPIAHEIAAQGYVVVIPRVRLNMAILDRGAGAEEMARFPEIKRWVLGGHSLGGTTAGMFAADNPDRVDGLVFWASYPSSGTDLSGVDYPVASISGTLDGLATPADIEQSRSLLPAATVYVAIDGGNHAQFGDYGIQSGDNPATIAPEDQWDQVAAATVAVLKAASER